MTSKQKSAKSRTTRALLLNAAIKVIGQKGYSGATVDEIVEVAGVSKGLAYYHFKSKAEIATNVLTDGIKELITKFEEIANDAPCGAFALNGMIECFADKLFDNKEFSQFFVSELWRSGREWSDEMRKCEDRLIALITGQLARAKQEGFVRSDVDIEFEAVALVGMVLTSALYYLNAIYKTELDVHVAKSNSKELFVSNIVDFVRHANSVS